MSATVVVVIAISCVLHASWNLLGRSDPKATLAFFGRMNLVGVAAEGLAHAPSRLIVLKVECAIAAAFLEQIPSAHQGML